MSSASSADVFQISPPLSQGVGYGIVVGVGAVFAVGMSLTSWLLSRYMNEVQDSEMFMTAKHSVKSGLTASAVVSSWTIATTLLTSTTYGYQYGVSGPFWYAAAACVQILLFSVAAVELKRKAPNAQTFLQVVKLRYGKSVHLLYTTYSGIYQIITTVNLLVGGSAVFSAMSGVNRDAICYLLPIGVVIYTLMGGIKATFITDWVGVDFFQLDLEPLHLLTSFLVLDSHRYHLLNHVDIVIRSVHILKRRWLSNTSLGTSP